MNTAGDQIDPSPSEMAARENFYSTHKVVFLYPEVATAPSFSLAHKHLGASYIRAFLQSRRIPTFQFTTPEALNLSGVIERLREEDPSILCLTVYDCTYHTVKMLVKELKAKKPALQVILGGPTATFSDRLIMEDFPEADLCVRGEGEYTLYEILEAFYHGRDCTGIAGLTRRSREDQKICRHGDRDLIRGDDPEKAMDILPSPYLEGIISPSEGGQIGIVTSRGCAFKCVYCNFSAMSRWTVRFHSVERVMAELETMARPMKDGQRVSLTIQDDAFTLKKERAKEICRRIIDRGLKLQIDCETRGDAVDRELLELMQKAGFRDLHFGVESGSPRILREIRKVRSAAAAENGFEPEKKFLQKIQEGVHTAVELGLKPTVSIILGLPGESAREGMESIQFISSLDPCLYYHNFLEIFAGTELFQTHDQYGIGLKEVYREAVHRLYKPVYTYDVSQVPVLEERSLFNTRLPAAEMAARLCGDPYLFERPSGGTFPELVVFTGSIFPDPSSIRWFLENAGSLTRLAFLWPRAGGVQGPHSPAFYELHMPLQMLYWLKERHPRAAEGKLLEEAFAHNAENFIPHPFVFGSIQDDERSGGRFDPHPPEAQRILEIREKGMGGGYHREVDRLFALRGMLYRSEIRNIQFLDVCRWSDRPCPARTLERIVVDRNRDLYPCLSGRPVGRVGEPSERIKGRISALAARLHDLRGCDRCPAAASCSQCLFPYPMSPAEFCGCQVRHFRQSP